jgi:hypothetical protein
LFIELDTRRVHLAGVTAHPNGTFRLTVRPGTYDLVVDSPDASCSSGSVSIPAGEFLGLRIACKPS